MAGKLTATATQPQPRNVPARGNGALVSAAYARYAKAAVLPGHGAVTAAAFKRLAAAGNPAGHGALTVPSTKQIYDIASNPAGHGALGGSGYPKYASAAALPGPGSLASTAVPVPQYDPGQSNGSANGYGSSFSLTFSGSGQGLAIVWILTGGFVTPEGFGYGAVSPSTGLHASQATFLDDLTIDNSASVGYLTAYAINNPTSSQTVTVPMSGTSYYAAYTVGYLNANTATLFGAAANYATSGSLIVNQLEGTPTYLGVGAFATYTGGSPNYSGSTTTPRGGAIEGSYGLVVEDIGPSTTNEYQAFTCSQGVYFSAMSFLLHA
jgi:hypothetical protein